MPYAFCVRRKQAIKIRRVIATVPCGRLSRERERENYRPTYCAVCIYVYKYKSIKVQKYKSIKVYMYICISFVLRPSVSLQSCDGSSAALEQAERTAESC